MTTLVLPYPVSANRYWRSFVPKGGKRAIVTLSDEAKKYREECGWRARLAGVRSPLQGRVALTLRLYPARPQDWAKRAQRNPDGWDDDVRCIDLGNAEKVLCDALNGIAWVDDKQIRRMVKHRCEPDEKGARVEIDFEAMGSELIPPQLPIQGQASFL